MSSSGLKPNSYTFKTSSAEETEEIGRNLGKILNPNAIVCLFGDLGAGKTTFTRGLVEGALEQKQDVSSPTFVYLNIYKGKRFIYHFDLYRLRDVDEFLSMGFDEYFAMGGVCCLEWSERIAAILPDNCVKVKLNHAGENIRTVEIQGEVRI